MGGAPDGAVGAGVCISRPENGGLPAAARAGFGTLTEIIVLTAESPLYTRVMRKQYQHAGANR